MTTTTSYTIPAFALESLASADLADNGCWDAPPPLGGRRRWHGSTTDPNRYHGQQWVVVADVGDGDGAGNVHFMDQLHHYPTLYTHTSSWEDVVRALATGPTLPY